MWSGRRSEGRTESWRWIRINRPLRSFCLCPSPRTASGRIPRWRRGSCDENKSALTFLKIDQDSHQDVDVLKAMNPTSQSSALLPAVKKRQTNHFFRSDRCPPTSKTTYCNYVETLSTSPTWVKSGERTWPTWNLSSVNPVVLILERRIS